VKTKRILAILAAVAIATCTTYALAQHEAPAEGHETAHAAGGHSAEGHETHEAGGHHGPAPINWTDISDKSRPAYIALAINFGILLAIYYAMGKKGVTEGLKKRRIDIGKDIDDARKMLDEAKERAKKYQADLKNADVDAATAKASLVSAGKGEVEHVLTEAKEKAERMKRDAERLVEQEKKQLHQDLLTETVQRAVTNAQKILEKSANSEDHARLAQELLAELGRLPAAKRVAAPQSVRPAGGAS
jgi:F-type H+-transporting ATPase subunit b